MIRVVRNLLLLGILAVLAMPGTAHASPVTDCAQDGVLDHNYSSSELRKALDQLPTDADEYSNCRQVIAGAIQGGSDRGKRAHGSGLPLTPAEQAARDKDNKRLAAITGGSGGEPPAPSLQVGSKTVEPGSNGLFDVADASNGLPAPLLVALIALAILALLTGLVALRSRVPLLGRIPLLSKIPTPRVSRPRFRR